MALVVNHRADAKKFKKIIWKHLPPWGKVSKDPFHVKIVVKQLNV